MMITKELARILGDYENYMCLFHKYNPDQEATLNSCDNCIVIHDPCGCDSEMSCDRCDPKNNWHEWVQYMYEGDPLNYLKG